MSDNPLTMPATVLANAFGQLNSFAMQSIQSLNTMGINMANGMLSPFTSFPIPTGAANPAFPLNIPLPQQMLTPITEVGNALAKVGESISEVSSDDDSVTRAKADIF